MGEFRAKHITDDGNSVTFSLFETVQELFRLEEDKKKNLPPQSLEDEPPVEDPSVKAALDAIAGMAFADPPSNVAGMALAVMPLSTDQSPNMTGMALAVPDSGSKSELRFAGESSQNNGAVGNSDEVGSTESTADEKDTPLPSLCCGMNRDGTACKRRSEQGKKFCYSHRNQG